MSSYKSLPIFQKTVLITLRIECTKGFGGIAVGREPSITLKVRPSWWAKPNSLSSDVRFRLPPSPLQLLCQSFSMRSPHWATSAPWGTSDVVLPGFRTWQRNYTRHQHLPLFAPLAQFSCAGHGMHSYTWTSCIPCLSPITVEMVISYTHFCFPYAVS